MLTTSNLGLKKPEGTDVVDINDFNGNADILDTAVAGKVDKVAGKQLSTEDYTAAEKSKLAGIAAGANNYVHPSGDGNLHVPATGTGNNTKVLKAGTTAGSAGWGVVNASEVIEDATHRYITDAERNAWNTKASIASPVFTGTPTAPTAPAGTNTTQLATTAFTRGEVGDRSTLLTSSKSNAVSAINELFTSVSDGKSLVAAAITDKGVATAANATFTTIAGNIGNIDTASIPGYKWVSRNSATDNNWNSVCYGNNMFVAIAGTGTGNRVMTSVDGLVWTVRSTPADNNWVSVCYGNGIFVAVASTGVGNRVMTSSDGITWTVRSSAADNNWYSVCYGNELFVAVAGTGSGNRVMTSSDGITWTIRSSAADNFWVSVCYGNGVFVAIANSGTGNRVMTSPDGIAWTIRSSAADNSWLSVCYGNGMFVSVANLGTGNRVMTSPDGITWTIRSSAVDNGWRSVCFGNGIFVAVADSGIGNRVMTSPDGVAWTIRTSPDNVWNSVCYGKGQFIAVAFTGTGNRVMSSSVSGDLGSYLKSINDDTINLVNSIVYRGGYKATEKDSLKILAQRVKNLPVFGQIGYTWKEYSLPGDPNLIWSHMVYGNGIFVGVSGRNVITSTDGVNWELIQNQFANVASVTIYDLIYANGVYLVVLYNHTREYSEIYRSTNASTWTLVHSYHVKILKVIYGNNMFMTIYEKTTSYATSTDGINWESRYRPYSVYTAYMDIAAFGNGKFVLFGRSTEGPTTTNVRTVISTDGIQWQNGINTSTYYNNLSFHKGKFILVGSTINGTYNTNSQDGMTWNEFGNTSGLSHSWGSMASDSEIIVSLTSNERILLSTDAINWASISVPNSGSGVKRWTAISNKKGKFVALGTGGKCIVSEVRSEL
jgi:hypothetical protein